MPLGVADLQILQLLGPVDARALLRELQQFELLAPLGHGEGHTVEEQRGRGQEGDDHLAGQHPAADLFDDVLDGQRQHVPLVGPDARREFHGRDAHHRAVADADEVAPHHIVVGQQRENIHIDDLRTDDHRTARIVVQGVDPLLVALRHLEAQLRGGSRHLPLEVLAHRAQVAPQHRSDHIHQAAVLLLALRPDAGALAVAQVVLQADRIASARDLLGREVQLAGPQRDHLADEVQHAVLHHHRAVGTKILRTVAHELARGLHAGKRLAANDDPRIGLVVLEQDVVARLQALDQGVLEQQRIGLAFHDDVADLDDLPHHDADLGTVLLRLHEVGGDPLAQALGLAHIDDRARAVHELVDPGRERQQRHLLLQFVVSVG